MASRIRLAIAGAVVLFAAIALLLKGDALKYNPLDPVIEWAFPLQVAGNAAGESVVMNGRGHQLVFLDRDGRVSGMVRAGLTKSTFQWITSVAMSDDSVYVADCISDGGGKYAKGFRVARFSLTGEYVGTVIEDTLSEPVPFAWVLNSLVCREGRLFAVAMRNGRLEVVEIVDGKLKTVREVPGNWHDVRGAWYFPGRDQLVVTTFARAVTLHSGDGDVRRLDPEVGLVISAAMAPDGQCYFSDRVKSRILRLGEDGSLTEVAPAEAFFFQMVGGRLLFSNGQCRQLLTRPASAAGEVHELTSATLASKVVVDSFIAWTALAVCGLFALATLVTWIVCRIRRRGKAAAADGGSRPLGMLSLYAANLVMVAIVLVIVSLTLTATHCVDLREIARAERRHIGMVMHRLSRIAIGDALDRIDPQNGYDSEDYRRVREVALSISDLGRERGGDVNAMIVRCHPGEPPTCLLSLIPLQTSFGDVLTEGERRRLFREEVVNGIKDGDVFLTSSEGFGFMAVPLDNSKGERVAVAFMFRSDRAVLRMIIARLSDLTVDLASILLVLVMLFGEARLLCDFLKLRKEQVRRGETGVTRCEVHRPIFVLQYMLLMQFLAFLPTLARESAEATGLTAGIFAILPVIIVYGGDYPLRLLFQERAQRAVRTWYQIGCAVDALAFLTLIAFAMAGNYCLLLVSVTLLALGTTLTGCCCTAVRACGREPSASYRMLVFTNMEPAIGTGIGAALGAFIYEKFGLVSVGVSALLLTATMWTLVRVFINSDINHTAAEEGESANGPSALRFVLSPSMLAIVGCMVFPMILVETFQAYTLPVFNEAQGNSVVLVGLALMVIQFLSLFTVPQVLKLVDRIGNSAGMVLSMAAVMCTILLYAFIPSMMTILFIVFAFNTLSTVVLTCAERTEIAKAELSGVSYASAAKYLILGEGLAYAVGGPLFGYLQSFGYGFLGFAIFFALLLLLLVYLLVSRGSRTGTWFWHSNRGVPHHDIRNAISAE